jgi:single-stranded DNA-binding protein
MHINHTIQSGTLTDNPTTRTVGDTTVTNANMITVIVKAKQSGELYERKTYHEIAAWGVYGRDLARAKKGDRITVVGTIQSRSWDDAGKKRWKQYINAETVVQVDAQGRPVDNVQAGPAAGDEENLPF